MNSRRRMWRGLCLVLAIAWLGQSGGELQADEASAYDAGMEETASTARVVQRRRSARRRRAAVRLRDEKSPQRFQMMTAGDRIVILDTQTGETRIIEPEIPGTKQTVKIGASWITVTVLINVERAAKRSEKPAPEK